MAKAFHGSCTFIVYPMFQTAYFAMSLPHSLQRLGYTISNQDNSALGLRAERLNTVRAKTVVELVRLTDYRPFQKFLHLCPLENATDFM